MIGAIRLVNPERGTIWGWFPASDCGYAVTTSDGGRWEIQLRYHGDDYWPGRHFARHEIGAWAAGAPLSAEEISVLGEDLGIGSEDDELGPLPATGGDPRSWTWRAFAAGEMRLPTESVLPAAALSRACAAALQADAAESCPLVDRWELWGADLAAGEPVALLLTGVNERDARGTYSPRWRFCQACEHDESTRTFEAAVNGRLLQWPSPGRVRHAARLFERVSPAEVREVRLHPGAPDPVERLTLPVGLLVEPLLSEYRATRHAWELTTKTSE